MDDLAVFIIWPDTISYLRRILLSAAQLLASVYRKNIVSSALRRWLILGDPVATLIPVVCPLECAILTKPREDFSTDYEYIRRQRIALPNTS